MVDEARAFCPKCRRSSEVHTTNDVGEILSARCACGWSGSLASLTPTNRTLHLRPPDLHHVGIETSVCGWMGVELTDDVALVQCRSCRRRSRPRPERVVVKPSGGTLHMERMRLPGEGLDARPTLCGTPGATTNDPGLVRCRRCHRALGEGDVKPDNAPPAPAPDPLPFEPGPPVPLVELGGATSLGARDLRIIERSHEGDDDSDRPRWRTLEAAITKTTAIKKGRSPMRSGFRIEQESRSEGAVRTEDGRDDVIEIDRAFARAFVEDVHVQVGTHTLELNAAEARALLEDVLRDGTTASQWADDLTRSGRPANRELVARVIQDGKAAMRALLERKGLIERRVRTEQGPIEAGQEDEMAGEFDVVGWKRIAEVIERAEGAAQRYAERETDPLPVYEQLGRVVAKRSELLAWLSRQTVTRTRDRSVA